jgi:hypothetical protein
MLWHIYILYQNLCQNIELYRIRKPKFIPYTKTYNYIVCQNIELYRIRKPRFIPYTKA